MFGSTVLDVAIGVVFVYLLFSVICMAANEAIEAWLRKRASFLERGIESLLGSPELRAKLYNQGMVLAMSRDGAKPSYIPSAVFASALIQVLFPNGKPPTRQAVNEAIRAHEAQYGNQITAALLALVNSAYDRGRDLRTEIEAWYDASMDRVSGWYRRRVQFINLIIAAVIVCGSNADTLRIARGLAVDGAQRSVIVASASEYVKHHDANREQTVKQAKGDIQQLGLPLGWSAEREAASGAQRQGLSALLLYLLEKLLGLLITTLAVTLGAPFWFDVLNRFMVVRSTVKPDEKSQPEGPKDPTPEKAVASPT